jgi:hypothetical protein
MEKLCLVLGLVCALGCQTPSESNHHPGDDSPCVTKMKAGQACGAPNVPQPICQDGQPAPMMSVCSEDETVASLGDPTQSCGYAYTDCKNWCNYTFSCSLGVLNPACYGCVSQCYNEWLYCRMYS